MATVESFTTDLGTLATSVATLVAAYATLKTAAASGVPLTQAQLDALDQTVVAAQNEVNAINLPAPSVTGGAGADSVAGAAGTPA